MDEEASTTPLADAEADDAAGNEGDQGRSIEVCSPRRRRPSPSRTFVTSRRNASSPPSAHIEGILILVFNGGPCL
jgi:hypothetical protein